MHRYAENEYINMDSRLVYTQNVKWDQNITIILFFTLVNIRTKRAYNYGVDGTREHKQLNIGFSVTTTIETIVVDACSRPPS